MAQFDIYLAGAMGGRTVHDVWNERCIARICCEKLGLTYYDPAEDEGVYKWPKNQIISTEYSRAKMQKFVSKDLTNVSECRAVLNLTGDRLSDGTAWEMAYAAFYRHIPVYVVSPRRKSGELMGFTNILADKLFKDTYSALKYIKVSLEAEKEL